MDERERFARHLGVDVETVIEKTLYHVIDEVWIVAPNEATARQVYNHVSLWLKDGSIIHDPADPREEGDRPGD